MNLNDIIRENVIKVPETEKEIDELARKLHKALKRIGYLIEPCPCGHIKLQDCLGCASKVKSHHKSNGCCKTETQEGSTHG